MSGLLSLAGSAFVLINIYKSKGENKIRRDIHITAFYFVV